MRSFLFTLFCIPTLLNATHNRAGEIIYKQVADRTVEATIITYTQTSSIAADRDSLEICWGDNQCEFLVRTNGKGEEIVNDYKINYYTGIHTYADQGSYPISMTDPNRNANILNVGNSSSDLVQFHIQSTVIIEPISADLTNQSPLLLESPIDIGFVHQPFMHTPNAIDLDGDSIAYELVTPLSAMDEPVPDYKMVNDIGESESNTYSFDEKTGLFIWNSPQLVGQYNIAIKIKSFRNGVLQDMMVRDMQILIMPDGNLPPIIEPEILPEELIEVTVGTTIDLSFTVIDPEDGMLASSSSITATSESLEKGAAFNVSENRGSFQWTIKEQDIRALPYQVVFKAMDSKGLATYKVVQIMVNSLNVSTSSAFKEEGFKLFPNPATSHFTIEVPTHLTHQPADISIFNTAGILVDKKTFKQMETTIQWLADDLVAGSYIIQIETENSPVLSTLLMKQ